MKIRTGIPLPLGSTVQGGCVNFSMTAPKDAACSLLLYKKGDHCPSHEIQLEPDQLTGQIRCVSVEMEPARYEYNFKIDGTVTPDPAGRAFSGRSHWKEKRDMSSHKIRTRIVQDTFDWEGDAPLHLPADEVIAYSLHVRGFTKHASSQVPSAKRGTFSGILEKAGYLQQMGINQIHCMPLYDFEEKTDNGINYWGYGPAYYYAPKAAYASGSDAVLELKELVKALHRYGMELILEMPFTADTPATVILDCLKYYRMEFHVDGFLVNPCVVSMELLLREPLFADTKILRKKEEFQMVMRKFLKGDEGMVPSVIWHLKHLSGGDGTFNYITSHNGFTLADAVAYERKHNEENGENNQDGPDYNCTWNCGAEGPARKKSILSLRKNQMRNAFFLLLLAQGTPCILAGDEFANSQKGNNNVYCQDNPVSWLSWNQMERESELVRFVKDLIWFRKKHRLLHPKKEMEGIDSSGTGIPDVSYHGENAWQTPSELYSRQLGVYYSGEAPEDEDCFVAYNMHWEPHDFALPKPVKGKVWHLAASTEAGVLKEPVSFRKRKSVTLPERSIMVFVGRQEQPVCQEKL